MIDKESVNYRLPIAVIKNRRAEDLRRVKSRCRRQTNFYSVEVIENTSVLGDIVVEASEVQFGVGEFSIEQVPPVAFVHYDTVVLVNGCRGDIFARVQNPLYHPLNRSDMHRSVGVWSLVLQLFDAEYIGEGLKVFHPRVFESVGGLFTQGRAIDQEKNSLEALRLKQTIDERDTGLRLTRTRGHRDQHLASAVNDPLLDGSNCRLLVMAQLKVVFQWLGGKLFVRFILITFH